MALEGKSDMDKLKQLSKKCYRDQAIWYLNAYWTQTFEKNPEKCEEVWTFTNRFIELDQKKKKKGNELNEFDAHRFLEQSGRTLSVKDMRLALKEIDIDFNKKVSLTEIMIYWYKGTMKHLVNASQGEKDMEKINQAQALLEKAQAEAEVCRVKAEEAKAAAEQAKESKLSAIAAENEAKKVEAKLRKAQAEQQAAVEELKRQEAALAALKAKYKKRSENMKNGVVKRNKAAQQLAQLEAKDPLPLTKAKITQEAVVKKCAKATKKAEKATAKAVAAREKADADEKTSVAAANAAEAAVAEAQKAIEAAHAFLEKVKQEVKGAGKGKLWFMDRELEEAMKYMPKSKLAKMKKKKNKA